MSVDGQDTHAPDSVPLILKCACDERLKRIRYPDVRRLTWTEFRQRITRALQFEDTPYSISYADDDGEHCDIASDDDLVEAVSYFTPSTTSSNPLEKISMRVSVRVQGLSLSDFGSSDEGSSIRSGHSRCSRPRSDCDHFYGRSSTSNPFEVRSVASSSLSREDFGRGSNGSNGNRSARHFDPNQQFRSTNLDLASAELDADLQSLHLSDLSQSDSEGMSGYRSSRRSSQDSRGGWRDGPSPRKRSDRHTTPRRSPETQRLSADALRQNARLMQRRASSRTVMLRNEQDEHPSDADVSVHLASQWGQPIEERSEAEILSSSESDRSYEPLYSDERQRSGMLESDQREREANGRVSEQGSIVHGGPDAFDLADEGLSQLGERSTLGDELETASDSGDSMLTVSGASSIVRPTVLATLAAASALIRPTVITSCSGCNTPFNSDSLRYVCDVCGPGVAVPEQDALDGTGNGSPSERTEEAGSNEEESEDARSEPASETSTNPEDGSSTAAISLDETTSPPSSRGFELCFSCLDSHGKTHAAATGLQTLDGGAQTVPRIQHAFRELMWEGGEWKPVEDEGARSCMHCASERWSKGRYKCSHCEKFDLCGDCYGNVLEIHPVHTFLRMRVANDESAQQVAVRQSRGQPVHIAVRCDGCGLQSIVGPRWHCASCVGGADFCSSCEEHGRIYDRGHKPAHILIKIMTPLGADVASTLGNSLIRAQQRLYAQAERNALRIAEASAANVEVSGPSEPWVDDLVSAWGGDSSALTVHESSNLSRPCGHDHAVPCSACFQVISGSRFLCANCPLTHNGFNLCASCEKRSLKLHDPAHFFIKLATPLPVSVDRGPYAGAASLLPPLYRDLEPPVGVQTSYSTDLVVERCISSAVRNWRNGGRRDDIEMRRLNDNGIREANLVPLDALIHPSILCDACFEVIEGPWLRCCNCAASFDLCSRCETHIQHDPQHVFAVFKQPVDMALFKSLVDHSMGGECGQRGAALPMLPMDLYN